jgi:hypothetical protein
LRTTFRLGIREPVPNADAVSRFFTEDVVTFDLAPPLKHTGFDRKMLEGWFKTWGGRIGYELTAASIYLLCASSGSPGRVSAVTIGAAPRDRMATPFHER